MKTSENKIQWQPLIEMMIVLVTILGSTIPLYLHTDTKVDSFRTEMQGFHNEIRDEMKNQSARTDRLYEMFIDLIKEGKK